MTPKPLLPPGSVPGAPARTDGPTPLGPRVHTRYGQPVPGIMGPTDGDGEGGSGGRDHGPSRIDVLRGGHRAPAEGNARDLGRGGRSPVPGPGPAPAGLAGRRAAPGRRLDPAGRGPRS